MDAVITLRISGSRIALQALAQSPVTVTSDSPLAADSPIMRGSKLSLIPISDIV